MPNALTSQVCSCGKDIYRSRSIAVRAAKELVKHSRRSQRELRVYECTEQPGAFHLTQERRTKAARASAVRESQDRAPLTVVEVEYGPKIDKPKVVSLKAKREQKRGPEHTACRVCRRRWLSDIDPRDRRCPGCGKVGTIVIGWADRSREWIRSVAA